MSFEFLGCIPELCTPFIQLNKEDEKVFEALSTLVVDLNPEEPCRLSLLCPGSGGTDGDYDHSMRRMS
jgi:hypothetical protein